MHKGIIKQQYTGVRIANCDPQECNQPWFSRVAAAMSENSPVQLDQLDGLFQRWSKISHRRIEMDPCTFFRCDVS